MRRVGLARLLAVLLASLLLGASLLPEISWASDSDLDTTFDTDGKVTTAIGSVNDYAWSVAIQSDGKIVAAGWASNGTDNDFALARYNSDGSLDTSFGSGGLAMTPIGSSNEEAHSVAIQSDGKIVAAGYSSGAFALARYNTDGSLDTTFSGDGKVTSSIGVGGSVVFAAAIQPDGKIVVAGYSHNGSNTDFALARYNVDGSLDTSFDSDGKVTTAIGASWDEAESVAIQSDGKMVAAGYSYAIGAEQDFALARYNSDGSLDTSFDSDGKVTTAISSGTDQAWSVAIQPDGRMVVAGKAFNGSNEDFALARYNTNGSLDTSFGSGGLVMTPIGSSNDQARSVAIQSDGKIVAAGYTQNASNNDFALARYGAPSATSISINAPTPVAVGTMVRITGKLQSTDAACVASQQVTLKKGTTTLGPKLTGATGGYRFRTKITAQTVVQASFAGTASCGASKSARKTIRVT